jgi:hypothetical protein
MSTLNYTDIVNIINGGGVVFLDCGGVPKLIDSIPDIPPDLSICGFVERNLSEYIIVGSPAIVQGASAQTANLMEWRNSAGTALATLSSAGSFILSEMVLAGTTINRNVNTGNLDIAGNASLNGIKVTLAGSGTQRLLLDSSGNLTISGAITIGSGAYTTSGNTLTNGLNTAFYSNAQGTAGYDAGIQFRNGSNGNKAAIQPNSGKLEFYTDGAAATLDSTKLRMTIDTSGNVGIGTTVPDAQLTINSQDVARPSLKIRALAGTASTQNVFESYNSSGTLTSYIQDNGASYFGNGLIVNNGIVTISNGSASKLMVSNTDCRLASDSQIGWSSSTTATSANADTAFVRATVKVASLTDGSTGGATLRTVPDSPTQLTADQNNYQAGTGRSMFYRLSSDASRSITGFNPAGGTNQDGELHYFINVGSNNIVLVNESASSTAGNRFLNVTGADITLATNEMAMLVYDNTSARWRVAKM